MGRLATWPSLTLTITASTKTAAQTSSRGRLHQSVISSRTLSVIREIVSLLTDAP